MRSVVVAALALPLVVVLGCGDRRDMDFGGREIGPDVFSIESTDGAVRMGLTEDYVYLTLSDAKREEVRSELRSEAEEDGVAGRVAGFVERAVSRALEFRDLYPVDDVEDIRWEDGEMHMDLRSGRRPALRVGDEPASDLFDEASVREFRERFHALKRQREGGGG